MTKSFLEKPNREFWENLSPKDGARCFLEFIEETARGALSPINDKVVTAKGKRSLQRALAMLRPAFDNLEMYFSNGPMLGAPDPYTALRRIMSYAFEVGQHGTATKSAKNFFRPMIESEMLKSRGASGGKESGKARLIEADDWRAYALARAKSIRAKNPTLSQRELADKIPLQWDSATPCRPSMLIRLISKWENEGKLPRRKRNK